MSADTTTCKTNGTEEATSMAELPLRASHEGEIIPLSKFPPLSVFETSTTYPALIVPVRRTAELRKTLASVLLQIPKIKCIYNNPNDDTTRKLVLSNEDGWQDERVQSLLSLAKNNQEKGSAGSAAYTKDTHTLTLTYHDLTVEEVLRKILPSSISELPSAFEIVGSIAHLNLREDVLPFKYIVGKVLLDKNQPRIKTVVNKLGSIANEYRTFGMEVIAGFDGPHWSLATVKEEGCEFTLDFQQVYWNSRLGAEHKRLVRLIQKDARIRRIPIMVVADLMGGVGPFAVPLTACQPTKGNKKSNNSNNNTKSDTKIVVHANDLNPASYKYLKINGEKNKCPSDCLHCYNMDARTFCHLLQGIKNDSADAVADTPDDKNPTQPIEFHHVIMNLPAIAPEFLDAFRGFTNSTFPRIHVYCFAPKPPTTDTTTTTIEDDGNNHETEALPLQLDEVDAAVMQRCSNALGCSLDPVKHDVTVRIVRDVSPKKNMVCVSFTLPEEARKLPRITIPAAAEQSSCSGDNCNNGNENTNDAVKDCTSSNGTPDEPKQKRAKTQS